jgi:cytochrome c1
MASEEGTVSQSDPMQFARGAKSWADTCARCHNYRDAGSIRDDQWRAVVAHMRVRAGLTADEAEDILVFLQGSN